MGLYGSLCDGYTEHTHEHFSANSFHKLHKN